MQVALTFLVSPGHVQASDIDIASFAGSSLRALRLCMKEPKKTGRLGIRAEHVHV